MGWFEIGLKRIYIETDFTAEDAEIAEKIPCLSGGYMIASAASAFSAVSSFSCSKCKRIARIMPVVGGGGTLSI